MCLSWLLRVALESGGNPGHDDAGLESGSTDNGELAVVGDEASRGGAGCRDENTDLTLVYDERRR